MVPGLIFKSLIYFRGPVLLFCMFYGFPHTSYWRVCPVPIVRPWLPSRDSANHPCRFIPGLSFPLPGLRAPSRPARALSITTFQYGLNREVCSLGFVVLSRAAAAGVFCGLVVLSVSEAPTPRSPRSAAQHSGQGRKAQQCAAAPAAGRGRTLPLGGLSLGSAEFRWPAADPRSA